MSKIFIKKIDISYSNVRFYLGSGTHVKKTESMLADIEKIFLEKKA